MGRGWLTRKGNYILKYVVQEEESQAPTLRGFQCGIYRYRYVATFFPGAVVWVYKVDTKIYGEIRGGLMSRIPQYNSNLSKSLFESVK